ncbi:MAG: heme exporter protein [Actinomycetota bacterium]|nr:heme exporter protein [Actinomycetota bacterium]
MSVAAVRTGNEAGFVSKTLLLARKDLVVEARGRETLPAMLAFSFAVTLLLAFTLPPESSMRSDVPFVVGTVPVAQVLAGYLWVTILFAGLIGFARAFEVERADGAIDPLVMAPLDRSGLFAAKALSNLVTLLLVQVFLVPTFGLLFGVNLGGRWFVLIVVIALVDVGFVMVGTLFSALAAQTRSRELMLPILALPILVPIFIAATELTADLFAGGGMGEVAARGWFGILIASDVIFSVVGALAFEFVVER